MKVVSVELFSLQLSKTRLLENSQNRGFERTFLLYCVYHKVKLVSQGQTGITRSNEIVQGQVNMTQVKQAFGFYDERVKIILFSFYVKTIIIGEN